MTKAFRRRSDRLFMVVITIAVLLSTAIGILNSRDNASNAKHLAAQAKELKEQKKVLLRVIDVLMAMAHNEDQGESQ